MSADVAFKHKTGYMPIGCGYWYAALRVGLSLRHPSGREIYVQPGDAEALIRECIEALDEVSLDPDDKARGLCADIALGEYFP